jgi:exopolyphosphatase/pppGpp-phosphohydrolase
MPLKFLTKLFGSRNDRLLKQYRSTVTRINALEPQYEVLTDEALRGKTEEFKTRIGAGESLESILPALVHHQDSDRAIATSKTLRTIARLCGDWYGGNGKVIKSDAIRKISSKLATMSLEERSELPGVSANRARQIVAGAFVAESVMRNLDLETLEVCPWALREGVVLKWMDWMEA